MNQRAWISLIIVVVVVLVLGGIYLMRQQQTSPEELPPASAPGQLPTSTPTPAPEIPEEYKEVAKTAVKLVADSLNIAPEEVTVLSVKEVMWSDTSLGCPEPGKMYAQVITKGYLVVTQAQGQTQQVHMDTGGHGVICPPERQQP